MDLRQLQALIAIIENKTLGRAAAALNVSQPALTKSMKRLEERLGVPLLYRGSSGTWPTEYGEALLRHAQNILAGYDDALAELESIKSGAPGSVRVAAGPLVTSEILAAAVGKLAREHPRVRISIHTAIGDLTPDLVAGTYDFVLAQLPLGPQRKGLAQRQLIEDRISIIARRDHQLVRHKRVEPRDLLSMQWVLPEKGHNHRRRLDAVFAAENLPTPEAAVECSSTELIKSVVKQTGYLGLVARMGLRKEDRTKLAEVAVQSVLMRRPIGIIWRQHQVISKSGQLFISAIETCCHEFSQRQHLNVRRGASQ